MTVRPCCTWFLVILLAACGQVPRPFQPEAPSADNDLVLLRNGSGLLVLPLEKGGPNPPEMPARAVAKALQEHDVPAKVAAEGTITHVLHGRAVAQPIGAGREEVLSSWELQDKLGRRILVRSVRSEVPQGAWRAGRPEAVAIVARDAAAVLATAIQEQEQPKSPRRARLNDSVTIVPIDQAPGNAARVLPLALEAELLKRDLPIGQDGRSDAVIIVCDIELSRPVGVWQVVTITWRVVEAVTGEELGRIDQQNRVPKGSLDDRWDDVAGPIAEGAADGIADLIGQLRSS